MRPFDVKLLVAVTFMSVLVAASGVAQAPAFLVKDITDAPVPISLQSAESVTIGATTFFLASTRATGRELWKTDGSEAGGALVKDIRPGSGSAFSSAAAEFANVNGTLLFTATDGTHGRELWKSDGTEAGTVLVKDINPGPGDSSAQGLTSVNGTLFFTADDGVNGLELWKSDGTEAGTVLVKDIYPGDGSSDPYDLTNVNGTLFFTADDGVAGTELWKSDGTEAGTVLGKTLPPAPGTRTSGL